MEPLTGLHSKCRLLALLAFELIAVSNTLAYLGDALIFVLKVFSRRPGKSHRRGRLNTVDLLALSSIDHLLFKL